MSLNEDQINNLIHFYFNINRHMDSPFVSQDPSYILEKWGKWINRIENKDDYDPSVLPINDIYDKWSYRWSVDELQGNNVIRSIGKFISIYESANSMMGLEHLVSLFEECFPNVKIHEGGRGVLHPIIEQRLDEWMDHPINVECLFLMNRDYHADNLLTD